MRRITKIKKRALTNAERQQRFRDKKKALRLLGVTGNKPRFRSPLDMIAWSHHYCGYSWDTPYLRDIADKILHDQKILVFVPRGHGKTFLSIAIICRYLLEEQMPVLILTSGAAQQRRIYRRICRILKHPKVTKDYPYIIGSTNRSTCEILPSREISYDFLDPLLRVASRGADIVGSHPRWIHIEDLLQEPFKSDESNEYLIEWWGGIVEFCLTYEVGKETKLTGTGTRKDKGDFWEVLTDEYKYPHYTRRALKLLSGSYPTKKDVFHQTDGSVVVDSSMGEFETLNCPSWTLDKLLAEYIYKPERFMAEMQNNPMPKGGLYFSVLR